MPKVHDRSRLTGTVREFLQHSIVGSTETDSPQCCQIERQGVENEWKMPKPLRHVQRQVYIAIKLRRGTFYDWPNLLLRTSIRDPGRFGIRAPPGSDGLSKNRPGRPVIFSRRLAFLRIPCSFWDECQNAIR